MDDDTLFLRPGQLKGEDHNSPSRLSMRKTWQYRTGARFFQRCSERLRKKYGKDFTQCYSSDCIRWHLINTLSRLGFTQDEYSSISGTNGLERGWPLRNYPLEVNALFTSIELTDDNSDKNGNEFDIDSANAAGN